MGIYVDSVHALHIYELVCGMNPESRKYNNVRIDSDDRREPGGIPHVHGGDVVFFERTDIQKRVWDLLIIITPWGRGVIDKKIKRIEMYF
jgi:hypothetical protein